MTFRNFIAGSALVTGIRGSRAASKSSELFSGVEKPTITLAYMLCAEMLQNLDVKPGSENYDYDKKYLRSWVFPSFRLTMQEQRYQPSSVWTVNSYSLNANPKLELDGKEKAILCEGFLKFKKIWDARRKNEAETARQEAAVNAIASFFGKPAEDTKTEG